MNEATRQQVTTMYEEFDDNDNIEGNDDDMAALGSILSWDEADENENSANKSDEEVNVSLNEQVNRPGMQAPFETLQFPNIQSDETANVSISAVPFHLQIQGPLPTSSITQEQNGQKLSATSHSTSASVDQRQLELINQQRQSTLNQQGSETGIQMSLSVEQQQFIAQNPQAFAQFLANTVLQQPSQTQNQQLPSQPQQQLSMGPLFSGMQVPQNLQQNQIQPPKQQSVSVQQPQQQSQQSFASDQTSLFQHFQLAQYQQQLQTAQPQPQAVTSQPNMQIQVALQQLQAHFTQTQASLCQGNANQTVRIASAAQENLKSSSSLGNLAPMTSAGSKTNVTALPLKKQKFPTNTTNQKSSSTNAAPKTKMNLKSGDPPVTGIVSASDTEGEASRRAKAVFTADDDPSDTEDVDFSHLSPTEKLKASRDRNREHARNTRLRKKAYLEKLKLTVDELCRERDTLVSERAGAASLLVEMHNTRTEVLMSLFALRTSNERRRKLWTSILDESCFTCVMPVTPYRSFPASEVQVSKCLRTVLGIDGMIADTASLHVLFDSLVDRATYANGKVDFRYTLVTEEAVVAGNQVMARWVMTTTNAVKLGARMEVTKQGMLCCKFNSSHKIISLELMFDVMAFMLQLKQASGSEGFTVVPNTLQTCQRSFDKPMVMTHAEPPYAIIQVNKLWEEMTGFSAEEVIGRASCAILQASDMDKQTVNRLMDEVRHMRPSSALLGNRRKSGEDFTNFLVVYPLSTDSRITYFLGLTLYSTPGKPIGDFVNSTQQSIDRSSVSRSQVATTINMGSILGTNPVHMMQNPALVSAGLVPTMGSLPTGFLPSPLGQMSDVPFRPQGQILPSTQHLSFGTTAIGSFKRPREGET